MSDWDVAMLAAGVAEVCAVSIYMYICMYACVFEHTRTHTHTHTHAHAHTHTHTHTDSHGVTEATGSCREGAAEAEGDAEYPLLCCEEEEGVICGAGLFDDKLELSPSSPGLLACTDTIGLGATCARACCGSCAGGARFLRAEDCRAASCVCVRARVCML
jgi:hypothetical protein